MAVQYDNDEERKLHFGAIHTLADQYHLDESRIREIYESELEKLMDSARVKTYLSVLTIRLVKNQLHDTRQSPKVELQQEQSV
jgi:hypothetical protein